MNMLGLLPKITDEDWGYIEMWLRHHAKYERFFLREELPLLDRKQVKAAGENWIVEVLQYDPHLCGVGSSRLMKKLFG